MPPFLHSYITCELEEVVIILCVIFSLFINLNEELLFSGNSNIIDEIEFGMEYLYFIE